MTTSKGGRPATGSIRWRFNPDPDVRKFQWFGRVKKADGSRPWAPLDPSILEHEEERARASAVETAAWFRDNPHVDAGIKETVAEYANRWLADRVGRVFSVKDDVSRMRDHVLPTLGHLDASRFTRDDVEKLRDALDEKIVNDELSWKTVSSVWTLVTSMAGDMVNAKKRELRTRTDNPCRDVKPPERGDRKAKQFLYPSEFLKFVSHKRVPLRLRVGVTIAVCTFVRDGELRALKWDGGDVDLEHGTLSVTRALTRAGTTKSTKSGETRRFAIEPALLPLLAMLHKRAGGKGSVVNFRDRHMSRDLRLWLKRAGVTRPELHNGDATRKALTWHDLRATGLTWMAVRGDDPLKIKQRAGHSTFSTTELYIRQAEAVREGFGDVFPTLPDSLLGLDPVWPDPNLGDESSLNEAVSGGGAGNRTRVRKRLARASTYVAGTLNRSRSRLPAGSPGS